VCKRRDKNRVWKDAGDRKLTLSHLENTANISYLLIKKQATGSLFSSIDL
jgi:hypothetical protein